MSKEYKTMDGRRITRNMYEVVSLISKVLEHYAEKKVSSEVWNEFLEDHYVDLFDFMDRIKQGCDRAFDRWKEESIAKPLGITKPK